MYFVHRKTTFRGLGGLFGMLIGGVCTLMAFFLTIIVVVYFFFGQNNKLFNYLTLLLWSEGIFTLMTFAPGICDGPNSALWNLPLLATDLVVVVIFSTLLGPLDVMKAINDDVIDTRNWRYNSIDVIRTLALAIVVIRYTGLAWTDQNFFLKRLVAPLRRDDVKESASYNFGQVQDPLTTI